MSDWRAQLLRLSLFPEKPFVDRPDLWASITGAQPEIDEYRSREAVRRQVGPFNEDALLEVQSAPVRQDLLVIPKPNDANPVFEFGRLVDTIPRFTAAIRPWLERLDEELLRVAFGVVAIWPAPDKDAAYYQLQTLLPSVKIDPINSTDFFYQINRPRSSVIDPGLKLNCLSKWNAVVFRTFVPGQPAAIPNIDRYHSRCELDVNTTAERTGHLEKDKIVAILDELTAITLSIAEKGELA